MQYTIEQFELNKISYKLCYVPTGHFNLLKDSKVVMSFWSYTGKVYSTLKDLDDCRGIKSCIKEYKEIIK